ncbi:PAS domain S-box-containing protein [Desulfobotulus alkaliphilus]|uniref:histidine kinase n=1 Tax=Desulfobotulus alkaliphilus TaxID=622671 RepID=A0A562RCW8_9BACT|nr:ATP-binding protein [Desulfobotulus alkaliphilus]TWI66909.1 PAS domain S-box-containing protein [Desulfobotulus alkaliphilus]
MSIRKKPLHTTSLRKKPSGWFNRSLYFLRHKNKKSSPAPHPSQRNQIPEAGTAFSKNFFHHAPVGIFCTTAEGRPLEVNMAMAQMLGFDQPEDVLDHYLDLASELYLQTAMRETLLQILLKKRKIQDFEFQAKTRDGRQIWLNINARMQKRKDKTLLIEGFCTEITSRKHAEKALHLQSRLQGLLMEIAATYINLPLENLNEAIQISLGDMAIFVEADRSYICTYDFQSQICTNTHEWCAEGIEPQIHLLQAVPFSAMEDWIEAHTQGAIVHIPDVSALPRGGARDVLEPQDIKSLLAVPMMHRETCLGFIGFDSVRKHHDYSDREQKLLTLFAQMLVNIGLRKQADKEQQLLQAQLLQAQKMESVGRLAGGVAHDFNNMLSVILGHSELALDDLSPESPVHNDLLQIRQAAHRSADLTRQLLAFARKQTAIPRILDLNKTISGMLKMLHRLIGEDIQLHWLPEEGLWPVMMDPGQIDQILANLCVNARDAIDGTGEITIRTGKGLFDMDHIPQEKGFIPGEYVVLSVHDTGTGMGPEILRNLFEPFFTTKAPGKGTGLGLATIYGIVKQNGGYIDVRSRPSAGTSFAVYLPRYEGMPEESHPEESHVPPGSPHETILLAEDEPAILKMNQRVLEGLGYTVVAAPNPETALSLAKGQKIDLLITDVIMPDMNGRDLADTLKKIHPELRTIFTSGYTADVIDRHGVLNPGVHFIQKPFTRKILGNKVREVLDETAAPRIHA